MTVYGYARVSSTDQNLDRQREALADVDNILTEKVSGKNRTDRPVLDSLLTIVREGDVIRVKPQTDWHAILPTSWQSFASSQTRMSVSSSSTTPA